MSYENTVEVVDLLTEADLVKFANDTPPESQAHDALARCEATSLKTRKRTWRRQLTRTRELPKARSSA